MVRGDKPETKPEVVTAKLLTRKAFRIEPASRYTRNTMDDLAASVIASFDKVPETQWDLSGTSQAKATFSASGQAISVTFSEVSLNHWRASFDTNRRDSIQTVLAILGGVFHAVREFLEVRQPMTLTFASKDESLTRIYTEYLTRKNTELEAMGYESGMTSSSPLQDFTIRKTKPSEWRN